MNSKREYSIDEIWMIWISCFDNNDVNSISSQLFRIIWDTAIYKVIEQGRNYQVELKQDTLKINGYLHSFIDRNYHQSQLIAIRKIIDCSESITGKKGIYSLGSLVKSMKSYCSILTREKYFELRKLKYDYSEIMWKEKEFIRQQRNDAFFVPEEFNWEKHEEAHQLFDRLCRCSHNKRKPNDLINERVFDRISEKLDKYKSIKEYVDKYIAHAASKESRYTQNKIEVHFKRIWEAHKTLFEVMEFFSSILLSEGHLLFFAEPPRYYDYWDTPLFVNSDEINVQDIVNQYRDETKSWHSNAMDNLWNWIEN